MIERRALVARIKRSKARPGLSRSLTVRLPTGLYDKLEAYAGKLAAELPGVDLTVSDIVRNLLEQSLIEQDRAERRNQRNNAEAQKRVKELHERGILGPKEEEGI